MNKKVILLMLVLPILMGSDYNVEFRPRAAGGGGGADCDASELSVTTNLTEAYVACDSTCSGDANCTVTSGTFTWTDQFSTANNLTETTNFPDYVSEATSTLTASCGHITFDGTNDQLLFGTSISGDNHTVCALIATDDNGLGKALTGHHSNQGAFEWRIDSAEKQELLKSAVVSIGTSTTSLTVDTARRVCVRYDAAGAIDTAGTVRFWYDGAQDGSAVSAQTFGNNIDGIGSGGSSEYFAGDVILFIKYDTAISNANIDTIMTWMTNACD